VKVRPERVFVWPGGDPTSEPEVFGSHVEEVRSGQSEEELEPREPAAGGGTSWDGRIEELGARYDTAVLGWVAPDGFPLAVRLPVSLDREAKRIRIDAEPAGLPIADGRACLTAHSHHPDFEWQENFQVRGDLVREESGLALVPHKLVGGFELPKESQLAMLRRNFSKARRYHRIAKERRAART
jgi:hypothetical protein